MFYTWWMLHNVPYHCYRVCRIIFINYDVLISKPFGKKTNCKDLWVMKQTNQ